MREEEEEKEEEEEWGMGEKGIGSAVDVITGTMPSGHSAIVASNPAFSLTTKPPLILSGSPVLAIGSAQVSSYSVFILVGLWFYQLSGFLFIFSLSFFPLF